MCIILSALEILINIIIHYLFYFAMFTLNNVVVVSAAQTAVEYELIVCRVLASPPHLNRHEDDCDCIVDDDVECMLYKHNFTHWLYLGAVLALVLVVTVGCDSLCVGCHSVNAAAALLGLGWRSWRHLSFTVERLTN